MERCYVCGGNAALVEEPREVPIGNRSVMIEDRFYRCEECGETFYTGEMGDEFQNGTADTLLRVVRDHPDVVAELARERGMRAAA